MQFEEIKVLVNDYVEVEEEKGNDKIDSDTLIDILWKKKQRLQCLE